MSSVHIPRVLAGRNRASIDAERENFEKSQVYLYKVGGQLVRAKIGQDQSLNP